MNYKTRLPTVFVLPSMLMLGIMAFVPTFFAIFVSMQDRELGNADVSFVWFSNFIKLFSDRRFLNSIVVSLTWEFVTVTATMLFAIGLGILLYQCATSRWKNVLSMLFIMPVLLPRVSAAFVWKFAFHPLYGLATFPYRFYTGETLDLLANSSTALLSVAVVDVWQWGMFFSVIVLKLLETLPRQPLEAAWLDHANTLEVYFYVAIPMLKAPLISLTFVKMIESLRAFDLIYVMTRGGPGIVTETLDMYAFSQGFIESGRISYASSMGVLMMVATSIAFTYIWKWTKA